MKVFVIGSTGFIGVNLVLALLDRGYHVVGLARSTSNPFEINHAYQHLRGDRNDVDLLMQALEGVDIVIDLGYSPTPHNANSNNINSALKHAESVFLSIDLARVAGASRYIYCSSGGAIYGVSKNPLQPFTELDLVNPVSQYGLSKSFAEKICSYVDANSENFRVFAVRPTNPYGPNFPVFKNQGVINVFMRKMLLSMEIEIWGDPNSIRKDYIYIDDLVRIFLGIIDYRGHESVFNASSGFTYSLSEIISAISFICNLSPPLIKSKNFASQDIAIVNVDNHLAMRELDWRLEVNLEEGIRRTFKWLKHEIKYQHSLGKSID